LSEKKTEKNVSFSTLKKCDYFIILSLES